MCRMLLLHPKLNNKPTKTKIQSILTANLTCKPSEICETTIIIENKTWEVNRMEVMSWGMIIKSEKL